MTATWATDRGSVFWALLRVELIHMTKNIWAISMLIQVVSVVVGVVISVLSFSSTRQKEALARKLEAAAPFLQLRQSLYLEALKAAAILANPDTHTSEELATAKKRFRELYVAELSMVEPLKVETKMVALAKLIDPELTHFTPAQRAALELAHALRDTFVASWGVEERTTWLESLRRRAEGILTLGVRRQNN
jgi:hypothetical protein